MNYPPKYTNQFFKAPMRAAKSPADLKDFRFPALITPKLDGIRTLTQPCPSFSCRPVSRSFHAIPNKKWAAKLAAELPPGLDGESYIPKMPFFDISSKVMTQSEDTAGLVFAVFDFVNTSFDLGYRWRMRHLAALKLPDYCTKLIPVRVNSLEELLQREEEAIQEGHEGIMIRSLDGPYKFGQSTLREGFLIKLKRFEDAEAKCVGFKELMHNDNAATQDAFGRSERSSHKENKRSSGLLGALCCRTDKGVEFDIGTGFTAQQRKDLWESREKLRGQLIKYSSQPSGMKNKPRFPKFLGIRHKNDL